MLDTRLSPIFSATVAGWRLWRGGDISACCGRGASQYEHAFLSPSCRAARSASEPHHVLHRSMVGRSRRDRRVKGLRKESSSRNFSTTFSRGALGDRALPLRARRSRPAFARSEIAPYLCALRAPRGRVATVARITGTSHKFHIYFWLASSACSMSALMSSMSSSPTETRM